MGDKGPRIDNHRLKSIPPAPIGGDEYSGVRAAFRFDPLGDAALSAEPAVTLSAEAGKTPPPVWVRKFELHSWYESQGAGRHLAAFDVHNCGAGRLRIALPPGVSNKDIRGMWIDESPVDWLEGSEKNNIFAPLPSAKRFCTVSVYYTTRRSGLGTLGTLAPPLTEVDVPTLAGTWTVWLPPGYEAVGEDQRWQGPHRPEITFSRRLLGPLGRDPGQKVFNPFAAQDWLALAATSDEPNPAPSNAFRIDHIPTGCSAADTQCWSARRLEISAANASGIKYIRTRMWQLWAAMVFVLALGVGYWKAGKYPIFYSVLTGVFGVAALVLPEIYVPLASAAVLGMLACLLLMIIKSCLHTGASSVTPDQAASKRSPPSDSKKVLLAEQSGAILLIAAAVFFAWDARAEEPAEKARSSAATDYRVFVPIDEEKKPTGDKVYLPEEFFDELYRRASAAKEEPQGWLLESALYRGSLEREASGGLSCQSIKAQFDLRVFGRLVQVRIPLRRENARPIADVRHARRPAAGGEMGGRRRGVGL